MHDLHASLDWTETGTALFLGALDGMPDAALDEPTALPGWTGRHLIAHVAGNANALVNLARWATTGIETPMYASSGQRDTDIAAGVLVSPARLRLRARESAAQLTEALRAVPAANWGHEIRTAQGRVVPAAEIPWLRAREVMIHTVDLGSDVGFDALPVPFLLALVDEVVVRRSTPANPALVLGVDGRSWTVHGTGSPAEIHDSLGCIAALLTGRPVGAGASEAARAVRLPPWL